LFIYPWGNTWDSTKANTSESNYNKSKPVGSYERGKSWVGAYDMTGNVYECVVDWLGDTYYQQGVKNDPTGPKSGEFRGVRGGSWGSSKTGVRAAYRTGNYPETRGKAFGFRIVSGADSAQ
jgi:formylglycine-generating enzyme required for sulfatase activity